MIWLIVAIVSHGIERDFGVEDKIRHGNKTFYTFHRTNAVKELKNHMASIYVMVAVDFIYFCQLQYKGSDASTFHPILPVQATKTCMIYVKNYRNSGRRVDTLKH